MDLVTEIRKAREITVTRGHMIFRLRVPSRMEVRTLAQKHKSGSDIDSTALQRVIVLGAMYDWEGVTRDDILGDGATDPVPFSPELAAEWLDDAVDIHDELGSALWERITLRRDALEADEKN